MARRIAWWVYVVGIAIGFGGGAVVAWLDERHRYALVSAPWIVSALMVILGIVILYLAVQVHRYTTTDPKKRAALKTFINPDRAVNTLVLAKALAVAGALLVGWYGGQVAMLLRHWDISYYRSLIIECAVACGAALFDMIAGIVGEWLCQLPPTEGPEHPKGMQRARRNSTIVTGRCNRTARSHNPQRCNE